jgi:uncharacterized cupin superfamily protein
MQLRGCKAEFTHGPGTPWEGRDDHSKRSATGRAGTEGRAEQYGAFERLRYSDAGGLTQFGAHVETLQPGSRSSDSVLR